VISNPCFLVMFVCCNFKVVACNCKSKRRALLDFGCMQFMRPDLAPVRQ
jgi:hypothetical protein